ncbi:PREDICTED: uncharacterized protein LOC104808368 [Tarenaya hassleriana]|uniref:uncharacterized protein LOC104808368 n=1 Tax=Tarenaya hassleriana TaxID=28532 RepID=UPI00053C9906|nr:PREDICTED: uncharacterized protein LOC104808368 [Tarenaya hassleriana]
MSPFEALYGRSCKTPLCWTEIGERRLLGPDIVDETTTKIKIIQKQMKAAQDRQKSYADKHRRDLTFQENDEVFLKVQATKGKTRFGMVGKLKPRFIGPFKVLSKIGAVTYKVALPPELAQVHDVFNVSILRKCHPDPDHVIDYQPLELKPDETYEEEPIEIVE